MPILFLAKKKPFAKDAARLLKLCFPDTDIFFGEVTDPFPEKAKNAVYDYVFSYISPWIIPKQVLDNTKIAAINFHPGPPEYPGIGCTNFAIYYGEKEFGITVHHMEEKVDSGKIIMVKRFPIFPNDTVYTLTQRCYAYIFTAFIEILDYIVKGLPLPEAKEHWKRQPFTRKDLNELRVITPDMDEEEIKRRVKATTFPKMPGAFIELGNIRFIAEPSLKAHLEEEIE